MAERFRNAQPAAITQCSQLDRAIWSRLPEEVLEVVFAQLPVEENFRLSCLSKCWKRNVVQSSRFKELCAETSSRMFAFVCEDYYKRADHVQYVMDMLDSKTAKWIRLEDQSSARDSVWGTRYNWLPHELDCIGPCVWDSAALQLNELDIPLPEDDVRGYALLKDRLFVLHMDDCSMPSTKRVKYYCISEYQGRTQRPNWVLLRTIGSMPFKLPRPPTYYRFKLHVCEGYFLVVANNEEWYSPTRNEIAWLYDLSTDEWRTLPRMPGLGVLVEQDIKHNPLCELRWDVDPDPKNVPGAGASSSL